MLITKCLLQLKMDVCGASSIPKTQDQNVTITKINNNTILAIVLLMAGTLLLQLQ